MKHLIITAFFLAIFLLAIPTSSSAQAIAAGISHSLALKSDGTVWAWGANGSGQLGNGTNIGGYIPVQVKDNSGSPLTDIIAIAGGGWHSLALRNDSTVWAWGSNSYGQLGNGSNTDSNVPVQVSSLTGIIAIAGGSYHSLALKCDGTVWAWGYNVYGQLGNGTWTNSNVPVQVSSLTSIIAITGGPLHSLAVKNDGTVWAWGANGSGQLGNGTWDGSNVPVQVSSLTGIIAFDGGGSFSLAVKNDGTVWAWGDNYYGQLGNGTNTNSNVPLQVNSLTGINSIAAGGGWHSIALKSDETVWSWGYNFYGQLGNGTWTNSNVPVQVNSLTGIIAIAAGGSHSLALKSDGTIWAWGDNLLGQLGNNEAPSTSNVPVQVNFNVLPVEIEINKPDKFSLYQNYPNPFNPNTTIEFIIPQPSRVNLKVYNLLGQEVRTLVNEMKESGTYKVNFDAKQLSNGVYIYKLEVGNFKQARKMILMK